MGELAVAVCQLTSVDDVDANLRQIREMLEGLHGAPPDLVCFPENALYLRVREGEPIPALELSHPVFRELAQWADKLGSVIHLGSVPLARDGRLFNSSVVIEPGGLIQDRYQKIHLFDVDVEGEKRVRESDVFSHGSQPAVIEVRDWKIGCSICYDLRFSELFLHYARLGVDVILIPSAFLVATGRAHWEILTRARAIESQAYVLAAAQGGVHRSTRDGSERSTYGRSMIIDPWGEVLASCPEPFAEADRVLRTTLSKARIAKVRAQIPMRNHRRLK